MLKWIEQRTGLVTLVTEFLTEDVPGGASYWYIFGSATLFALILQIVTGIFLTFYYAPSAATAWESTKYIYDSVKFAGFPVGQFVISLHSWGATAMIALVVMHLLQTLLWGAYKKPRELQWIVGVVLFLLTAVMGLTGYLLPWDLNAYFASKVAINIAGSIPIVGPAQQTFIQDGPTIGTLTINRFFGIHVWLMPVLLVLLTGLHLTIFRHNGGAGPPIDTAPKPKPGRFWPNQVFMDTVASFAVLAIIVALSIWSPTPLDKKADPNDTAFQPYPAWYFLALFQLLDIAGDKFQLIATVVIPGGLVALLILLPFLDRNPSRRLRRRPWLVGGTALVLAGAVYLSCAAQARIEAQQAQAATATSSVGAESVPQAVNASATGAAPAGKGATVFASNCAGCHGASGAGAIGPPLGLTNPDVAGDPKKVLHAILYGLNAPLKVAGKSYSGGMPAWRSQLSNADVAAVASYIRSSWGNKARAVTAAEAGKIAK